MGKKAGTTYVFGEGGPGETERIDAANLAQAIKLYKVKVLFPEKHVDKKYLDGYESNYWQCDTKGMPDWEITFKVGVTPKIGIHVEVDNKGGRGWHRKKVGEVAYAECVDVDYSEFIPKGVKALPAPDIDNVSIEDEDDSEQAALMKRASIPVVGAPSKLSLVNKTVMRAYMTKVRDMQRQLAQRVGELRLVADAMKAELKNKLKIIYALEVFLGVHEDVVQLLEGENEVEDTPLTIYQQTLYMDEEVGIWEDGGLDIKKVDVFDEWISRPENYERYLFRPKAICAFRVRRHPKERRKADDIAQALAQAAADEADKTTYFLIRNGTNLYRIFTGVPIGRRLFPGKTEYERIIERTNFRQYAKAELQQAHEQYMLGLIYAQGLIERTDIFGIALRNHVNLMMNILGDSVELIRDDEPDFWLSDGTPRWEDYLRANQEKVGVGTRVLLAQRHTWYHATREHGNESWRTAPFRAPFPERDVLYQIEKETETRRGSVLYWIYYRPDDEIYSSGWTHEPAYKRKRRVPCRLNSEDVLAFDELALKDIEFYERNRLDRENYLAMLPVLHYAKTLKRKEMELEAEFVKLIAGTLGWADNKYTVIRFAIEWWKLKNKWKRGLMVDDAKAVRMIVKKLRAGTVIEFERPTTVWTKQEVWKCETCWHRHYGPEKPPKMGCRHGVGLKGKYAHKWEQQNSRMLCTLGKPERVRLDPNRKPKLTLKGRKVRT